MASRSSKFIPAKARIRTRIRKPTRGGQRQVRKAPNRSFLAIFAVLAILALRKKQPQSPAPSPTLERSRKVNA